MVKVESLEGKKEEIKCISCALESRKVDFSKYDIVRTKYFNVFQDYEIPIPGFLVLSSRRHIVGFADFNEKEKKEFMDLICKIRKGMKDVLGIKFINFLFREDTIKSKVNPSHFHVALLPLYDWTKKFNTLEILQYARKNMKTNSNLKKVDEAVKKMRKYMRGR